MIRIWAPSQNDDPVRHGHMLKLAQLEGLAECLRDNGVFEAELMPPYPRGTFRPDGVDGFEIYVLQEDLSQLRESHGDVIIGDFIADRLDLLGGVLLPFQPRERYEDHKRTHGLTLLAVLD